MEMTKEKIAELYVALFGRAPEGEGLEYWYEQANAHGWGVKELAQAMYESAIKYPEYSSYSDPKELVEAIYENVLGKTYQDDPKGIDYWVGEIKKGHLTAGEVAGAIIYAAETQYPDHPATKTLLNRAKAGVEVAKIYKKFDGDFKKFKHFVEVVNSDSATVNKAVEEAGKEKVSSYKLDTLAKILPYALEETFTLWRQGELLRINKEKQPQYDWFAWDNYHGNLHEGTVHVVKNGDKYQLEYYDVDFNGICKSQDGTLNAEFKDSDKTAAVEVADDYAYENWNGKVSVELEKGFKTETYGLDYNTAKYPKDYHGTLSLREADGKVKVNGVEVELKDVHGYGVNGATAFKTDKMNLKGEIVFDGKEYKLFTYNLSLEEFKELHHGDVQNDYQNPLLTGEIILVDDDGSEIKFDYQASDPYSTSDDVVDVYLNGVQVEDVHLDYWG